MSAMVVHSGRPAISFSLVVAAGALWSCGGYGASQGARPASPTFAASPAASTALFDQPWIWHDEHGDAVALSKWGGATEIVTMFYASCTFRCPLTVARLKGLERAFAARGEPVHFVLVTLDPLADTADRLRAFKHAERLPAATWHLLAGSAADTRALARALGVRPAYGDPHIDHDVKVGVVDSGGALIRVLGGWHWDDEAAIVDDGHEGDTNARGRPARAAERGDRARQRTNCGNHAGAHQ